MRALRRPASSVLWLLRLGLIAVDLERLRARVVALELHVDRVTEELARVRFDHARRLDKIERGRNG